MLVLTIFVLGEAQHVMWMGNKYYIFLIIILFLLKKTFKSLLKQNIIGIMSTLASDILSLTLRYKRQSKFNSVLKIHAVHPKTSVVRIKELETMTTKAGWPKNVSSKVCLNIMVF